MNDLSHHVYKIDELVIGNSLEAVSYSYLNGKSLILNKVRKPYFFDFFEKGACLEKYMIEPIEYELSGVDKNKTVGHSKLAVWEKLVFCLSISGLIPISDKVYSLRVEDNKVLKIVTENSRVVRIKFDKLRIFDTEKITELDSFENCDKFKVVDWVDVRSGMKHGYDFFETEDEFVKEVYFYPSYRMGSGERDDRKDLVAVSFLTKEQLNDFKYSDTYTRFKVLSLMKGAGIKGARNGRRHDDPNKYAYYSVKIEPSARDIHTYEKPVYEDKEHVIFDYRKEREIYHDSPGCEDYLYKISKAAS